MRKPYTYIRAALTALALLWLLAACSELPVPSIVEAVSNGNRTWRVVFLQYDGQALPAQAYAAVRIRFQANGPQPLSFSAEGMGPQGILGQPAGTKPNFNSPANQGLVWEAIAGGLVLGRGEEESRIDFVNPPVQNGQPSGELRIRWRVPEAINKQMPTVIMHLVPAE